MELRYARPGDEDEIKKLWKTVFPDDPGIYFKRGFKDARVLVYEDGGQIVSMLHWTMHNLMLWGRSEPCAYILGVATLEKYRGRGLAGDLTEQALFELHLRGVALACLLPATPSLVRYYDKYGFYQCGARMKPPARPSEYKRARISDLGQINRAYEKMMESVYHLERAPDRWLSIFDEYDIGVLPGGGYAVYDRGAWMEGTEGELIGGHPTAACVRIIEAKKLARLAESLGKPFPSLIFDEYCPWNDTGGTTEGAECSLFGDKLIYVNLLHNGKEEGSW